MKEVLFSSSFHDATCQELIGSCPHVLAIYSGGSRGDPGGPGPSFFLKCTYILQCLLCTPYAVRVHWTPVLGPPFRPNVHLCLIHSVHSVMHSHLYTYKCRGNASLGLSGRDECYFGEQQYLWARREILVKLSATNCTICQAFHVACVDGWTTASKPSCWCLGGWCMPFSGHRDPVLCTDTLRHFCCG